MIKGVKVRGNKKSFSGQAQASCAWWIDDLKELYWGNVRQGTDTGVFSELGGMMKMPWRGKHAQGVFDG